MAHQFRSKMHQHSRGSSYRRSRDPSRDPGANDDDMPSSDGQNERTSLIQHHITDSNGKPLWENDRIYVRWPANFVYKSYEVLVSSYANVFLVFVPLGIIAGAVGWDPVAVFVLNFLAIIPLAALLSFATEELSAKLGQTIGGLMNATFGNAVELIVSIIALQKDQIRIVQASMLGSILSNILLVLGSCFIAGGIKKEEQVFDMTMANTMSSLLSVAAASLIIPAALYSAMEDTKRPNQAGVQDNIVKLSRGVAIIMLLLYCLYLYFQLYSHARYFDEHAQKSKDSKQNGDGANGSADAGGTGDVEGTAGQADQEEEDSGRKDGDTLSPPAAAVALVIITIGVAVCAEFLVDSIDSIVQKAHISRTFIGLILLPIVGNAAEHVTAVVVSYKSKMDLALNVAIGSSLQIAIFVTPFLVILGWFMGREMTLRFEGFETIVFFLSVLVVNYLIQDGRSNYLEGGMCIGMYLIIAFAFFIKPESSEDVGALVRNSLGSS
ncbi:MAG: hypothetical protein M1828_001146 [Chrysothrix sp. TS-e1954]|nr:MAG: hypothetical protein M1828_001146 [Chrysothrix sp. TS-e1954]